MLQQRSNGGSTSVQLSDIAAELKLSKTAVSRVLSQVPSARSIPPLTQARIFATAKQMGYAPNLPARLLKQRKTSTIGVIIPTLDESYTAHILGGVEDTLGKSQHACMVFQHHRLPADLRSLGDVVRQRRVDGLITISTALSWTPEVPLVTIAWPGTLPEACNLQLDHQRMAQVGLKRLRAFGRTQLALICGQDESPDAKPRALAIQRAAAAMGSPFHPSLIAQLLGSEPQVEPGYQATKRLLAQTRPFNALFAFNDYTAIGAIRALREAGLRVPEDVAVLGVDDVQPAAYHDPPLTTLRQPLFKMGQIAANRMLERLEIACNSAGPELVFVRPRLIARKSA